MPSRLIRDGILDSSRYWSVTIEARQLFWHIMLLADDYGCCSAAPVFLKRRCFEKQPPTDHLLMLLQQLSDVDLIRQYDISETRYLFIPRFGQRLRTMKSRYPLPPKEIIDSLLNQRLDLKSASNPPPSAAIRRQVRPEVEEKGSEEKRRNTLSGLQANHDAAKRILEFLNETAGKRFRETAVNLSFITARLLDGLTEESLRKIVVRKCRDWLPDEKMRQFLRPQTLFNRTNCESYFGNLVPPSEEKITI